MNAPRRIGAAAGLVCLAAGPAICADAKAPHAQRFECEGENACRVSCARVADVGRVQRVVIEAAPWDAETLMLTVEHEFGVATLILRGETTCRLENLRAVR